MQRFRHLVVGALALVFAQLAHADCDRLFEALDKADKQERVAQYLTEGPNQPLPAKPLTVRIGKVHLH